MPARLTRRQALAGGTVAAAAAVVGGAGLVRAGVLPGRYRLARVMGACDVGVPATTVAPGPTRFGSFASTHRGRTVGYGVAWPPGSGPGDRLPVCLLLHAAAGDHHAPFDRLRMHHHLAQAVGADGLRPLALAAADGRGSSWHRTSHDDPFAMLLEELPAVLAGLGAADRRRQPRRARLVDGRRRHAAAGRGGPRPARRGGGHQPGGGGRRRGGRRRRTAARAGGAGRLRPRRPFAGAARALAAVLPAGAVVNLANGCHDGVFWQRQAPPSSASCPPRSPADRRSSVWGKTAVSGSIRPSRRRGGLDVC
jgi:hypothetical protein